MKVCIKCHIKKELNEFGKSAKHKSGIHNVCLECMRIRSKKQYKKHQKERKEKARKYAQNHKQDRKEYQDQYYAKMKSQGKQGIFANRDSKTCYKCKETLGIDKFNKRTASKDGHDNICKECQSKRDKERYRNNREREIQRSISYQKRNPEKAYNSKKKFRELADLTGWDLYKWANAVKSRDNNLCKKCISSENLEAHHIKPKAEYPQLALQVENGITLCKDCHKKEHLTV